MKLASRNNNFEDLSEFENKHANIDLTNVFEDSSNHEYFIDLETSKIYYSYLKYFLDNPYSKIVLLEGKPGTGKSSLLNKLYHDLHVAHPMLIYLVPITNPYSFLKQLAYDIFNHKGDIEISILYRMLKTTKFKYKPTIILDEAQLYPIEVFEIIRLLSDSGTILFILSLHTVEKEDVIAKDHFASRLNKVVQFENISMSETKAYIFRKLFKAKLVHIANDIDQSAIELIYKYAKGNFRQTNKILNTLFCICEEYKKIGSFDGRFFTKKHIEMSAIHSGLFNA